MGFPAWLSLLHNSMDLRNFSLVNTPNLQDSGQVVLVALSMGASLNGREASKNYLRLLQSWMLSVIDRLQ